MLLREVLKEFIFDCEIRKISPRTLKSYRNITELKKFILKIKIYDIIIISLVIHEYHLLLKLLKGGKDCG